MKNIILIALFALIICPSFSHADENAEGAEKEHRISIINPYAFGTMPGATTGAAFMKIVNKGTEDDYLIGAKAIIAKKTELHENLIDPDDGKMMMRKVRKIEVPHNGEALLHPKGHHVMFIKLKEPLVLDTNVEVYLKFKKSGLYKVNVPVVQPGMIPEEQPEQEEKSAEENHTEWPPQYRGDDEDLSNPVYKKIK